MYKTLIFDLDDTLTDDKANIKEAFKIVMQYMNKKYTPMIKTAIREVTGADLEIVFVTA